MFRRRIGKSPSVTRQFAKKVAKVVNGMTPHTTFYDFTAVRRSTADSVASSSGYNVSGTSNFRGKQVVEWIGLDTAQQILDRINRAYTTDMATPYNWASSKDRVGTTNINYYFTIQNNSAYPCEYTIYKLWSRDDVTGGSIVLDTQNPAEHWVNGLAKKAITGATTTQLTINDIGATPYMSDTFMQNWKIAGTYKCQLMPGQHYSWSQQKKWNQLEYLKDYIGDDNQTLQINKLRASFFMIIGKGHPYMGDNTNKPNYEAPAMSYWYREVSTIEVPVSSDIKMDHNQIHVEDRPPVFDTAKFDHYDPVLTSFRICNGGDTRETRIKMV